MSDFILYGGPSGGSMSQDDQVERASALAAAYKAFTGVPIFVGPNQMKYFRENGVDCSNLRLYPEMPK